MPTTESQCSFCSKELSDPKHDKTLCEQEYSALMQRLINTEEKNPFPLDDVFNLVFQGGGVKGVAYEGVLQRLQEVKRQDGTEFLDGVKRIAGSSAGSMATLYLGLGLSVEDIGTLMKEPFFQFLDDKLTLNVGTHGGASENLTVKDIVLTALVYFNNVQTGLEDPTKRDAARDGLTKLLTEIFLYYAWRFGGDWMYAALKTLGSGYLADLTKWLVDMLSPVSDTNADVSNNLKSFAASQSKSGSKIFEDILSSECDDVLAQGKMSEGDKVEEVKQKHAVYRARLEKYSNHAEQGSFRLESSAQASQQKDELSFEAFASFLQETKKMATELEQQTLFKLEENVVLKANASHQGPSSLKSFISHLDPEKVASYLGTETFEKSVPMKGMYSASQLGDSVQSDYYNEMLAFSLGELLWFITKTQTDADGVKRQLGLFDASKIKASLIEKPIFDRLKVLKEEFKLDLEPRNDITFKELMAWNEVLPDAKKFKQFYITAFDTERLRTEVFSAEHTPDVVIADAVRASMSIPIFFTSVTVKERIGNELKDRTDFNQEKNESFIVHYMDGGVFDNYPMYLFDDYQYCFKEDRKLASGKKYSIANPHTLGFRLKSESDLQRYKSLKQAVLGVSDPKDRFQETFFYQMGLFAKAWINEAEENKHDQRGDDSRSVFVKVVGVSAIAFNLSDEQKRQLIAAGYKAMDDYLNNKKI